MRLSKSLPIVGRFAKARSGMAAVEFAMLLPVLITMFFGTVEVSAALACRGDVAALASTAADLIAQDSVVYDADIANVFSALNTIMYPYPTSTSKIIITSIIDDGKNDGKGTVAWSDAQNTTAHAVGSTLTVPTGLIASGGSVILAEVSYSYSSPSTQMLKTPITMTNSFYSKPRKVAQITRTNS